MVVSRNPCTFSRYSSLPATTELSLAVEMASEKLTEYERKRLENIKRNREQLEALNIHSKLADLSASAERHREETTYYRINPYMKAKSETPVVSRKSLRTRGIKPEFRQIPYTKTKNVMPDKSPRELTFLSMRDVSISSKPDEPLVKKILSVDRRKGATKSVECRVRASIDIESMELMPENIARVVRDRILSVKFFPSADMRMVVVGNRLGDLGFWNVDSKNEDGDGDGIYMYRPHSGAITSICIQPFAINKITTCCQHGFIRTLDIEKETFDLTYHSEDPIFCMSQRSNDINSIYSGENQGIVSVLDKRSGRSSMAWKLHGRRINTIDFNPENTNIMATSSSDKTACIWDLRKLGKKNNPDSLKEIKRDMAVYSAYFSPSGTLLATTSHDDKIGVVNGANYDDEFLVYHCNQTDPSLSKFQGVWGWDDSYVIVGSIKNGVDFISTKEKRIVTTLESPYLRAIPCRFDAHPFKAGMLVGTTSVGRVYIWSL